MPTIERQIDALGGSHSDPVYGDGYNDALTAALGVARDADALVEELIEWLEDALTGGVPLEKWAREATAMITRLKHRRAA